MDGPQLTAFDEFVDRRAANRKEPAGFDDGQQERFGRVGFGKVQHTYPKPFRDPEADKISGPASMMQVCGTILRLARNQFAAN